MYKRFIIIKLESLISDQTNEIKNILRSSENIVSVPALGPSNPTHTTLTLPGPLSQRRIKREPLWHIDFLENERERKRGDHKAKK
jgi:hypothetical protein